MSTNSAPAPDHVAARQRGFLGFVERAGNLLPEPTMIFVYLILALMAISAIGQGLGWSASLPFSGEEAPDWATLEGGVLTYAATSLFSEENIARLLGEMPRTMAGFAPLGLILVIMLGAAVAERSGMFSVIRGSLATPASAPDRGVIGMVSHHASDAAYVVFILAAIITPGGSNPWPGGGGLAAVSGAMPAISRRGDESCVRFPQEAAWIAIVWT